MNLLSFQAVAQSTVEHTINALPGGLLVAFFAWALLRIVRKQNSGTRFAVWFLALLTVVALPLLSAFEHQNASAIGSAAFPLSTPAGIRPAITIPGHWALLIFLAWAIGASVTMVRLATGLWRLRELRRSCTPIVIQNLDPLVRRSIAAIASSSAAVIATSDKVSVPCAIGFWKRTIVLPVWTLEELPAADLNVILLHEFAHLERRDDWTNLVQKILRSLFFFHPAVWWIEKQLSVEREMACDDVVLAQTANPHGYASCLISLLEKSLARRGWSMAQAAVHRAREASLRLAQILDRNRPSATRVWKPALGMVAAFSVFCLAGSLHAPQLVAFDSMSSGNAPNATYGASTYKFTAPAVPTAVYSPEKTTVARVVPATLRTNTPSTARSAKATPLPAGAKPGFAPSFSAVAAQPDEAALPVRATLASASQDPQFVPEFHTLVFVQATQYGPADSPVWSVQVWQVTFVNAVFEKRSNVPVANSI